MKTGPLPKTLESFLHEPNLMVIATVRKDGRPLCVPSWYEYRDTQLVINMDAGRVRLRHLRENPNVAASIMWHKQWFRHVSLMGHVVEIYDDIDMAEIDRISYRYIGGPYKKRDQARVSAKIVIDGWFGWDASTFAQTGSAVATDSFEV